MAKLQERLLLAVLPQMVALTAEQMDHGTLNQIDPPTLWCHVLSFERWLQLSSVFHL
jgi:hypothetical protein